MRFAGYASTKAGSANGDGDAERNNQSYHKQKYTADNSQHGSHRLNDEVDKTFDSTLYGSIV